ncbi:MAG TPA: hypothetical protein VMX97_15710 [Hyphomicrobiaceae bacterium]|nr:hypothetical protein [Hyphomicrobiaceae bacterium]
MREHQLIDNNAPRQRTPVRRTAGRIAHRAIAFTTAIAVAIPALGSHFATARQPEPITRTEYEACHTQDEAAFRKAIEAVTLAALRKGSAKIDYLAIVSEEWRRQNFDTVIDARVEIATAEVRQQTSWSQLLKTLAYREKAKELAKDVAERVYRSDTIKTGLEKLALGVGKQIGQSIELTTLDAAQPAQKCLRAFLGARYGDAVARVVTRDAGAAFKVNAEDNKVSVSTGAVVMEASGGLAGAVILVVRRQLARMAQRLGQRLIGSVLSRVVSVVATGVGVVLIAKDAWDFRHGVLPIISSEMKSPATKSSVRQELADAIRTQMSQQVEQLAGQTADQILDIWKAFRRAHAKALDLADKNKDFRKFLDAAKPDQLATLDEIVGLELQSRGEPGLIKRLADGTLNEALNAMPPDGLAIARELGTLEAALQWTELAGNRLAEVRTYELHRRAKPEDFSHASLARLLDLRDTGVIARLTSIGREARDGLFDLANTDLLRLTRSLSADELQTLSHYLKGLARAARTRILSVVAKTPASMRVLASARIRDGIIASRDQLAAVDMMLRSDQMMDLQAIGRDAQLAFNGRITPLLIWDKHPAAVSAAVVAMLMLLLLLRRLFSSGRRPASAPGNRRQSDPSESETASSATSGSDTPAAKGQPSA